MSLDSRIEKIMQWYKNSPEKAAHITPEIEREIRGNLAAKLKSGQKHWLEKMGMIEDE